MNISENLFKYVCVVCYETMKIPTSTKSKITKNENGEVTGY